MDTPPTTHHTFTDTLKQVQLDRLFPNPWQTRLQNDPAHIASLAEDIRSNGLLQPPLARPDPIHSGFYELAFGHSRYAAYQKLAIDGAPDFDYFPVHVRPLTDRQMADLAAAENARRKDLSAIETARALQVRIDSFHLTQAEAGQAFGLSQSAVANLLRLLKLPAGVQDLVHRGELPERQARGLVAVAQLAPKEVEKAAADLVNVAPTERIEWIADKTETIVRQRGTRMDWAIWALSEPLADAPACTACPAYLKFGGWTMCATPACFAAKHAAAQALALADAAERTGIPAAAKGERVTSLAGKKNDFGSGLDEEEARALLKAKKAERANLGLRWIGVAAGDDRYFSERVYGTEGVTLGTVTPLAVDAFLKARKSAAKQAAQADPEAAPVDEAAARDARRAERATALKVEHDITWLVKHACEWIAADIDIADGALALVLHRERESWFIAQEFPGLIEYRDELRQAWADDEPGMMRDVTGRRLLVLRWIADAYMSGATRKDAEAWAGMLEHISSLALNGNGSFRGNAPALGVLLPDGWDEPPIHHTPYNCWQCGTFAGQRKLTKGDLERGWLAGEADEPVYCSADCRDAREAAQRKPAAKKPAAAKRGRKAVAK